MTDRELIEGCRQNDRRTQNLLFKKIERKVFAICRRYSSSNDTARDIQQEAFIRIFHSLASHGDRVEVLESWVHKITVNVAIDSFRKERRLNEVSSEENTTELIEPEVSSQLDEEQLIELIQTIQSPYRLVFNLFIIDGYSHKEIADQLGITESTSRSYLVRAKEYLKKKLTGTEAKLKVYG